MTIKVLYDNNGYITLKFYDDNSMDEEEYLADLKYAGCEIKSAKEFKDYLVEWCDYDEDSAKEIVANEDLEADDDGSYKLQLGYMHDETYIRFII